jgi:Uncharacterised nucleotidyltransferase
MAPVTPVSAVSAAQTVATRKVSSEHLGALISQALTGAWRVNPSPAGLTSEQFLAVAPLALSTGAAALFWRQLPQQLKDSSRLESQDMLAAYRKYMLDAVVHEIQVRDIFQRMRREAVEPVLFKGWALARLYPEPGLRPYGDLDLWLRPELLKRAYQAIPTGDRGYCVELHTSFYPQFERSLDHVMDRSELIDLNGVGVRIPCAEDHLRFIALHFLYHGGWRPMWLCDVGLMIESCAANFDWDRCVLGKRKFAEWIACVIGLAHELLDADISGTPAEARGRNLPRWLAPAVLRQWGEASGMSQTANLSFSLPRRLLRPTAMYQALREHWRNPVQASIEMNAPFNNAPRVPLQLAAAFRRAPDFFRHLGREIRRA